MSGTEVTIIYLTVAMIVAALIAYVGFRIIENHTNLPSDSGLQPGIGNPYPRILDRRALALVTRQLRAVKRGSFQRQPILNKSEQRVFQIIEKDIRGARKGFRVFPQVNLGEILLSDNRDAFFAINSKRVDMLIVDDAGLPVAGVEFQGAGHFQGTAEVRDAIKSGALRKAGIGYVEIFENDGEDDIRARVREHLGWEIAQSDAPVTASAAEPEVHFGRARSTSAVRG